MPSQRYAKSKEKVLVLGRFIKHTIKHIIHTHVCKLYMRCTLVHGSQAIKHPRLFR